MCAIKFFLIVQAVYILPAATFKWLHICRKAYIIENAFPIQRICEIAKAFTGGIARQLMRRENNCFRYWYFNIYCKSIIEKLFISTPPEWIIDNSSTSDCCIFKICTIERDILT